MPVSSPNLSIFLLALFPFTQIFSQVLCVPSFNLFLRALLEEKYPAFVRTFLILVRVGFSLKTVLIVLSAQVEFLKNGLFATGRAFYASYYEGQVD
jgi:hypothetical protein